MEELLKEKSFITKEFFDEPEPEEDKPEDYGYVLEKDRANKEEVIEPVKGLIDAYPAIENRVIGLFFSAGFCPPCRQFVPLLKDLHEELEMKCCPFQVVFISMDKTEADMKEYFTEHHGNWLAVPFTDKLLREELRNKYEVNSLPKLIIIKDDGEIITNRGRKEVQDRGFIGYRNWKEAANLKEGGNLNSITEKRERTASVDDKDSEA